MGEPARCRLKARHYEADAYGHINHAHYVHYLEVARPEALEAFRIPPAFEEKLTALYVPDAPAMEGEQNYRSP